MFASPRPKKQKREAKSDNAEVQYRSIHQLHSEDLNGSDAVAVQGRILQAPDEPKWVNITDRRTKQQELVPVVTILLADRTGPIFLDLWRNTAENLLQDLNAKGDPDDEGVIIEVRRCWVRTENKVCIPQTRIDK